MFGVACVCACFESNIAIKNEIKLGNFARLYNISQQRLPHATVIKSVENWLQSREHISARIYVDTVLY